jgi:hypothetical protein
LKPQSTVPPRQSIVHSIPGFIFPVFASATHWFEWHCATGAHSSSLLHESSEKMGDLTPFPGTGIVAVDELELGAVSVADVEGTGGSTLVVLDVVGAMGAVGVVAEGGHARTKTAPDATIATAAATRPRGGAAPHATDVEARTAWCGFKFSFPFSFSFFIVVIMALRDR